LDLLLPFLSFLLFLLLDFFLFCNILAARVRSNCILLSSDEELSTSLPLFSLLKDLELAFDPDTDEFSSEELSEEEDLERLLRSDDSCEDESLSSLFLFLDFFS
jgi:hypothetical protein